MPWDLLYYGAMAVIFIGIIAASRRARRARRDAARSDGSAPSADETNRKDD